MMDKIKLQAPIDTETFVNIYVKYPNLWDPKHDEYKSRGSRYISYEAISEEFRFATGIRLSTQEIQNKIKSVKSTYSQELAKIKQRSTLSYVYKPRIAWFETLNTILSGRRKSDGLCDQNMDITVCNNKVWLQDDEKYDDDDEKDDDTEKDDEASDNPIESDNNLSVVKKELQAKPVRYFEIGLNSTDPEIKKKKFKQKSVDDCDSSQRDNKDVIRTVQEDEFDIYGKYIASQLRSMNIQKALRVQLKIQNLVTDARLSELSDDA